MAMPRVCKLTLEALEDRLTPAVWGIPWPSPGQLTLSFVPDGTSVSNTPSSLFQSLNTTNQSSAWQQEILRAYQTWAVNSNINIGLAADGGQPLGASGAVQGDSRFGDFRVAMAALPATFALANTAPFDLSGGSWGGDTVFNGIYNFGIGGAGQYDLYTVALHEAGHSFGFADETWNPVSAMYYAYTGPRSGLSGGDITRLQNLYGGPRVAEPQANNSIASALYLPNPDQAWVTADVGSLIDADYYSFITPAAGGPTSFTVQIQSAGLSLLEPSVTVYDAFGNVVGSGAATSPLSNNVTLQINNALPSATYYVEVAGATSSVFGIGSYRMLTLFPNSTAPTPPGNTTSSGNNSFATAQVLSSTQMSSNSRGYTFNVNGNILTPTQADYYQVTAPALPVSGNELLTVTAASTDAQGLNPYVQIFDSSHNPVPAMVVNNGGGTFSAQLSYISPGTVYYLQVSALSNAAQNVGNYALAVQFNNVTPTNFTKLSNSTLTQAAAVTYQSLTVDQSAVFDFLLSANIGGSTVASAVRMTIYDQNNNLVFTLVAYAGQPRSTGFVFLQSGNYTVRYNAATATGDPLPYLSFVLAVRRVSDPLDPIPIDPTLDGTGNTGITIGSSTGGSLGTLPIISPYSNPGF